MTQIRTFVYPLPLPNFRHLFTPALTALAPSELAIADGQ